MSGKADCLLAIGENKKRKLFGMTSLNSAIVRETRETGHEKFHTDDVALQEPV